jgi:Zn-finger nucleic acid-binding protein
MTEETLEGHLGRPITIDVCGPCQVFWFDARESLRLSPASTLKLFRTIGEAAGTLSATAGSAACPRCQASLARTRDLQRNTRFEYLKCPNGHGRLTSFFNFLREKDFIRPLSGEQLAELRRNVQTLNCSNCGGPIDLSSHTACPHCASPLSMLDSTQAEKLVAQLRQADRSDRPVDPTLPLQRRQAQREVHGAFDAFEKDTNWFSDVSASGLVGAGLHSFVRWLNKS